MTTRSAPWQDALDLWAVRFLTTFSWRLRVRTFLAAYLAAASCAAAAAAVLAFTVVSAAHAALERLAPGSNRTVAWATVLVLAVVLGYALAGAVLREAFSRVRYAVPASPVRGLWLALDLPLRQVVAAERGTEQLPRLLVSVGAVVGTAAALAASGSPLPALAALLTLGAVLGGEGMCHLVAVRSATRQAVRRTPAGLWELYVTVLGLLVGAALPGVVRLVRGVDAGGLAGAVTGADEGALRAGALAAVGVGLALAAVVARALVRQPPLDVPLLGIDAAALVADRRTLWSGARRSTPFGAAAWGTGSMTLQPAVLGLFRLLVGLAAVALGVRLAAGPVLAGVELRGVALDAVARSGVALLAATLAGFVTAATVFVAGHGARLWHYRVLREMGSGPWALWAGHVVGAVVQCGAFGLVLAVALGALTGRVHVEIVVVAVVVAIADHLAESLFARPSHDDGERSGSTATAVVGLALVAPGLVAALVAGAWVWVAVAYVVVLSGGGVLCFEIRSRTIPVVAIE